MRKIIYDPYTPKDLTYAKKVQCAYPGCPCDAINSHLLQKNRWLKNIAEDGKVLQIDDEHLQSLLDGDEEGNTYNIMSINRALSLPIYCAQHDQKLFRDFEVRDLDLTNELQLLKLSYRAFCSVLAQEVRRSIFYDIDSQVNPICAGWAFDMRKDYSDFVISVFEKYRSDMYAHIKSKNVSDYAFTVLKIPRLPICLSDVIVDENALIEAHLKEIQEPFTYPIFMHALAYDNETVLIAGYDKRQYNDRVRKLLDRWKNAADAENMVMEWMILANNWCVAPSAFGNNPEEVSDKIMMAKIQNIYG